MLTREEAELAARALWNLGLANVWIYGDDREGFRVRASRYPPLSTKSWKERLIEIQSPEELARYLDGNTATGNP